MKYVENDDFSKDKNIWMIVFMPSEVRLEHFGN